MSGRKEDRHADRRKIRPSFCGVDGEGGSIRGSHEYLLLRAGQFVLETGEPLHALECLGFLADLPTDRIYVAYYFDYDVTMILRELPVERLQRLLDRDSRTSEHFKAGPLPIDWHGFQIDYLPGKEFRVRRELGKKKYSPWVVVNDVGSFFQSTFVTALTKWFGGRDEWIPIIDRIAEGKEQRNSFGKVTQDEREYNILEIKALELLMEAFRDVCDALDLHPAKWQGPGNLVAAQFKKVGMPRNRDTELFQIQQELVQFANNAYYGGRFEARSFGLIDVPIYQYDINSAYAYTYQFLPCLQHGKWEYCHERPTDGSLYVADVSFDHRTKLEWYTLPFRTRVGSILFPRRGRGTYWSTELSVSLKYGCRLRWHGGYRYLPQCKCNHFEWVYDIYAERQRIGKDARGRILKLILASIYGKLAQSVGSAPYANPIWAGLITSTVRAQLISATLSMSDGGESVTMLATDGLFATRAMDLRTGPELGEWDLKIHTSMFIVQSGVYYLGDTIQGGKADDADVKTRGVPQRKVVQHTWNFVHVWDLFQKNYSRGIVATPGTVRILLRNFMGLRLALARNRKDLAGQWLMTERTISFDWSTKRSSPVMRGHHVCTSPPDGNLLSQSLPYKRSIGALMKSEISRVGTNDQPDWADQV